MNEQQIEAIVEIMTPILEERLLKRSKKNKHYRQEPIVHIF